MSLPAAAVPVSFILTTDRAVTRPFYADVLGLPLIAEEDFGVVFDLGGGATLRLTDIKDHTPGPHTVLGWEVPDIRAAMADLRAKGVRFEIYEGFGQDQDGVWSFQDTKLAWFNDPEGNNLSLAQHG
ncbi:MAG: VOC family protein [Qipengyuania sp.]|jgi:catechol 2,3-dioxygenase-like lactoylglutathione lyase family enzyme|nr:VOC family protein [Qipengyuania sp.]